MEELSVEEAFEHWVKVMGLNKDDLMLRDILNFTREYTQSKVKKQREICANTITLGYFVDDDAEKRGNDHIRNAKQPKI